MHVSRVLVPWRVRPLFRFSQAKAAPFSFGYECFLRIIKKCNSERQDANLTVGYTWHMRTFLYWIYILDKANDPSGKPQISTLYEMFCCFELRLVQHVWACFWQWHQQLSSLNRLMLKGELFADSFPDLCDEVWPWGILLNPNRPNELQKTKASFTNVAKQMFNSRMENIRRLIQVSIELFWVLVRHAMYVTYFRFGALIHSSVLSCDVLSHWTPPSWSRIDVCSN